jgi:glyoxylate reductase
VTRPAVFVTRRLPGPALSFLGEHCEVDLWEDALPPPAETLRQRAAPAEGLLCLLTDRIDGALLDSAPRLRAVSNMATGYDNIDVDACTSRGVLVTRTPGVLSEATADFTFALLLAAARRIVEGDRYTREGRWKTWGPEILIGPEVHGAALGIVGMGGIGAEVARRARGFGMRILYNSRSPKPELEAELGIRFLDLDGLFRESDLITLHVPLTADTRRLVDGRRLALMKPSAVLVNTARGGLVDQEALYAALREGRIAAAGLDVTDPEPLPPDHPLLSLDNVVVTPHIASAGAETRSRMAMLAAEQLADALQGRTPPHAVNPEVSAR